MFLTMTNKLAAIGFVAALAAGSLSLAACGGATGAAAGGSAAGGGDTAATSAITSEETATGTQAASTGSGSRPAAFRARMQGALDPLVSQGTLTAGQESAVLDALAQRPAATTSRTRTFFTSRTGTAGGSRNAGGRPGGQGAFQKTALDQLVQQGTITAAQETAILSALPQPAPRPTATPTVQG